MARNSRRVSRSLAQRPALLFDVLHSVLAWLPQNDLRKAAGASRTFREAAKHAGLYIHRTIRWGFAIDVQSDVEIVRAVIAHAKEDNCRISLDLSCIGRVPWSEAEKDKLYALTLDTFETLTQCISLAMDNLVFLRVTVPDYFRTELDAVLLDPAPHLRTFEIKDYGSQGNLRGTPLIRLPTDLFAGNAPKLRSVALEYVPLGPTPIDAFSRVEHFLMKYEEVFPDTDVPRHFPRLRSLHIDYHNDCSNPATPTCSLRGLDLCRLTVEVEESHELLLPIIVDELELSSIPEMECLSYAGAHDQIWTTPLCADEDAELSARISQHDGCADSVSIAVRARDTDWRCTYVIREWDVHSPYAFFDADLDLVSLRLDNTCLPSMLESGITLPRLRELRIDLRPHGEHAAMIWPLAWGIALSPDEGGDPQGAYSVPCPALETLSIVALETPMQVRDTEVVQLSEALGQLRRKDGVRARLVLRGVSFFSVGLDQMFSSVQSEPFRRD